MEKRKISRALWVGILVLILLVCLIFFPVFQDEWLARKWEVQIKKHQDPEELRAWAMKLWQPYITNKHYLFVKITNRPPEGIPVSKYGPDITLMSRNATNGSMPYLMMIWRGVRAWGIYIGDTNFNGVGYETWKPGIHFYREP